MPKRDTPLKPPIPEPTSYTRDGDTHIWEFPREVVFQAISPHYGAFNRLTANIEACHKAALMNDAVISLLDERDRVNFHNAALRRDGTIDWGNHLVSLAGLVKQVLAKRYPEAKNRSRPSVCVPALVTTTASPARRSR
jgi:hypothetical protein